MTKPLTDTFLTDYELSRCEPVIGNKQSRVIGDTFVEEG